MACAALAAHSSTAATRRRSASGTRNGSIGSSQAPRQVPRRPHGDDPGRWARRPSAAAYAQASSVGPTNLRPRGLPGLYPHSYPVAGRNDPVPAGCHGTNRAQSEPAGPFLRLWYAPPAQQREPVGTSPTLTSRSLPQSTARVARFEVATGVGLAPVSPTIHRFVLDGPAGNSVFRGIR